MMQKTKIFEPIFYLVYYTSTVLSGPVCKLTIRSLSRIPRSIFRVKLIQLILSLLMTSQFPVSAYVQILICVEPRNQPVAPTSLVDQGAVVVGSLIGRTTGL